MNRACELNEVNKTGLIEFFDIELGMSSCYCQTIMRLIFYLPSLWIIKI